jgi:hypothetical protein
MIQQTIRGSCPTYAQVCDRAIELAVSGCLIQQKTTTQNTQRQAQKIRRVIDLYTEGQIEKEEMEELLAVYRRQQNVQADFEQRPDPAILRSMAMGWLSGDTHNDELCRAVLDRMTVYPDHTEVRLCGSEMCAVFTPE